MRDIYGVPVSLLLEEWEATDNPYSERAIIHELDSRRDDY